MVCKIEEYIWGFGSIVGPDYLHHMPTRKVLNSDGRSNEHQVLQCKRDIRMQCKRYRYRFKATTGLKERPNGLARV